MYIDLATTSPPIITHTHIEQLVLHTARHSRCKQRDIALLLIKQLVCDLVAA
ncbi:hypothetical protein [Janthinobacterium sp.]|uniref:hypothetical protein n=1 Tax=Janthinobacterium sp. TaxID=1871054 RepID=UPI00258C591A|nr:hypothetical protein [Janthinobacterium sp.]MCX7290204.1 hypothetical protein [Janthinobacterium sp.]